MWKLWFVVLVLGCSGEAEEDPPPPTSGATTLITLHWSWLQSSGPTCGAHPSSCPSCEASCADGCGATRRCCNVSKTVYSSSTSLATLAADYPSCIISAPAAGLVSVDCPADGGAPVYYQANLLGGTPYKYTGGADCTWGAPYPGP